VNEENRLEKDTCEDELTPWVELLAMKVSTWAAVELK
jgi:hypothetical protein